MMDTSDQPLQSLAKFHLSFEHNITWGDAKKATKARTTAE